jgi:DNA-binding transcriptional ArsR family regulator
MKTILNALAEPNRLHIVELLRDGPLTVGEIADRLSNAGLVEVLAIANRRIYKLRPEPFKELDFWLESYRHIWNERFDRLDDYLQELKRKEGNRNDKQ